jgi:hypothetical protein
MYTEMWSSCEVIKEVNAGKPAWSEGDKSAYDEAMRGA